MRIKEIVSALERFAPLPLQDGFDNAGLQIGLTEAEATGALLCLDVTEAVLDEAIALGYNLVISHHPLIFKGYKSITGRDYVEHCIMKAIKNDIVIYSAHTNLDNAPGGVNFKIAEKLGLNDVRFFGKKQSVTVDNTEVKGGEGVIGTFAQPIAADDLILMLKRIFAVECIQANQVLRREIKTIALCGGAGSFLLENAISEGADAFITGEMHYHDYFGHDQEIQICAIGHYQSEQFTNEVFKEIIESHCPNVTCFMTKVNTNPIIYL